MIKTWLETVTSMFVAGSLKKHPFYSRAIKLSLITIIPFVFSSPADARIPEPDNIVYGTLTYNNKLATPADSELTIRFVLDGNEIARYQMGSQLIGNNYALKIPLDVFEPRKVLTARPGEVGQIFVTKTGVNILVGSVIVGQRGSIITQNISAFNDSDGDGMTDEYELANGLNNTVNDANFNYDDDTLTNIQEFNHGTKARVSDTDGDGINDSDEVIAGTDPTDGTSYQVKIVSTPVISGIENTLYSYILQANQPNVVYELITPPSGMAIIDNAGVKSIQWTPLTTDIGLHAVSVKASVNGVPSDTQAYTLNIVMKALGDVNGDGVLSISDVLAAQRHLLGEQLLDTSAIARGDLYPVVGDGQITISDILLLQQQVLGGQ